MSDRETHQLDEAAAEADGVIEGASEHATEAAGPRGIHPDPEVGRPRDDDTLRTSPHPTLEHDGSRSGFRLDMHYSIIAQGLFRNSTNKEILASLTEANQQIGERRMQQIMATPAFKAYFEEYKKNQLLPIDKAMSKSLRMLQPEALTKVRYLMHNARSDATKLEATRMILEGGGTIRKITERRSFNVDIPPALAEQMFHQGQIEEKAASEGYKPKYRAEAPGNGSVIDAPGVPVPPETR